MERYKKGKKGTESNKMESEMKKVETERNKRRGKEWEKREITMNGKKINWFIFVLYLRSKY